jgi:hypothetical protein
MAHLPPPPHPQVYDRPPLEYDRLNRGLLAVSMARLPGLDYFRPPESYVLWAARCAHTLRVSCVSTCWLELFC